MGLCQLWEVCLHWKNRLLPSEPAWLQHFLCNYDGVIMILSVYISPSLSMLFSRPYHKNGISSTFAIENKCWLLIKVRPLKSCFLNWLPVSCQGVVWCMMALSKYEWHREAYVSDSHTKEHLRDSILVLPGGAWAVNGSIVPLAKTSSRQSVPQVAIGTDWDTSWHSLWCQHSMSRYEFVISQIQSFVFLQKRKSRIYSLCITVTVYALIVFPHCW